MRRLIDGPLWCFPSRSDLSWGDQVCRSPKRDGEGPAGWLHPSDSLHPPGATEHAEPLLPQAAKSPQAGTNHSWDKLNWTNKRHLWGFRAGWDVSRSQSPVQSMYMFIVFSFHSEWRSPTKCQYFSANILVASALLFARVPKKNVTREN